MSVPAEGGLPPERAGAPASKHLWGQRDPKCRRVDLERSGALVAELEEPPDSFYEEVTGEWS